MVNGTGQAYIIGGRSTVGKYIENTTKMSVGQNNTVTKIFISQLVAWPKVACLSVFMFFCLFVYCLLSSFLFFGHLISS